MFRLEVAGDFRQDFINYLWFDCQQNNINLLNQLIVAVRDGYIVGKALLYLFPAVFRRIIGVDFRSIIIGKQSLDDRLPHVAGADNSEFYC